MQIWSDVLMCYLRRSIFNIILSFIRTFTHPADNLLYNKLRGK
jgi:hypothetical protein